MEKQERKRASLRSDGKTGKEVSTDELNASMPIRSVHAAEYGCPQLTPCGRHRLERVVGFDWIAWSPSVGTRGRFQWNTQDPRRRGAVGVEVAPSAALVERSRGYPARP